MGKKFILVLCVLGLCFHAMGVAAAASSVTVEIPVQITLGGTEPAAPETFAVELAAADSANPMPDGAVNGIYRMVMEGWSSKTIDLVFHKQGVYGYTVKLVTGDNENCRYDASVYHITVFVTNGQTGYDLNVVVSREGETGKQDGILFENVYANPAEVVITASKTLDGKTPEDGAFTFVLLDSAGALVETAVNAGKTVTFDVLQYSETGTYTYQLKEAAGSNSKIIYDDTVYDVTVTVIKEEDGNYGATVTYEKDDQIYTRVPAFANETRTDNPKTGDGFPMLLWGLLLTVSSIGIAVGVAVRHRKQ